MKSALLDDAVLRPAAGIMACELGDGLAVLDQLSGTFYVLGEVETFIWRRLATPATTGDVARSVKETFDGAAEAIDRDLREFLGEMIEARLVVRDEPATL